MKNDRSDLTHTDGQVARVPYSLHSSFAEMEAFVEFLRPAAITGTPMLRAEGSGFIIQGSGFIIQGSGFIIQGCGFGVRWFMV